MTASEGHHVHTPERRGLQEHPIRRHSPQKPHDPHRSEWRRCKSNVLDAIRLLQGIGNGLSVAEILDGRGSDAAYRRSDGIRGGAAEVLWRGPGPGEAAETAGVMAHIDTPAGEVGYGVRIDPAPAKKRDIL